MSNNSPKVSNMKEDHLKGKQMKKNVPLDIDKQIKQVM